MKRITLILLAVVIAFHAGAQDKSKEVSKKPGKAKVAGRGKPAIFYVTLSSGINSNAGLLGLSFDVPVAKSFSVDAGVGRSSWGYKVFASGKYYLKPNQRGFAFGAGVTHSTGLTNYTNNMETIYGDKQDVTFNLYPATNMFVAAYRYWSLGHRHNRFFLQLGWSFRLTPGRAYDQIAGDPISTNSVEVMNILTPGGLIIGAGFSFGMYSGHK